MIAEPVNSAVWTNAAFAILESQKPRAIWKRRPYFPRRVLLVQRKCCGRGELFAAAGYTYPTQSEADQILESWKARFWMQPF
jgi:hypothetical protein